MKNESIKRLMSKHPVTLEMNVSLLKAEKVMRQHHIRHVPIVKGKKLLGILSLTDLQRMSFASNFGEGEDMVDMGIYNMLNVGQVMVANPITIGSDKTIYDALVILSDKEFHALPVVEGEEVVGIVTSTDLLRKFKKLLEE